MPEDIIKIKSINEWLDYNQKIKGNTLNNIGYVMEYKKYYTELGKWAIILYFLTTRLNITYCRAMMFSAAKQRKFITSVLMGLKDYEVEKKYKPLFEQDIKNLKTRVEHIGRIVKEDVRLTEYGAFFEAKGYDLLTVDKIPTKAEVEEQGGYCTILDYLAEEAKAWNKKHPKEVEAHLESIKPELEAAEKHKAEVKEKAKAERQAKREAKKAENAEVREIKKNNQAYKKQREKLERSFSQYYK